MYIPSEQLAENMALSKYFIIIIIIIISFLAMALGDTQWLLFL